MSTDTAVSTPRGRGQATRGRMSPKLRESMLVRLMAQPELFAEWVEHLRPEHFNEPDESRFHTLWQAVLDVHSRYNELTYESLRDTIEMLAVDTVPHLNEHELNDLLNDDPEAPGLVYYALHGVDPAELPLEMGRDLVRRFLEERVLADHLRSVVTSLNGGVSGDMAGVIADLQRRQETIDAIGQNTDQRIELDVRRRPPRERFPIGETFDAVEAAPKMIIMLGGQPGGGKTGLAMQWVTDALLANPDLKATIANVEMPAEELIDRQVSRLGRVSLTDIRRCDESLNTPQASRYETGLARMAAIYPRLDILGSPTKYYIEDIIRAAKKQEAKLLVLDYIQKIGTRTRQNSTRETIVAVMQQVRHYADEHGVCVIVPAALTRHQGKEGGTYAGSGLGSFRESSEAEYCADDAWIVEPQKRKDTTHTRKLLLRCVKSRYGELHDITLSFEGRYQQYSDYRERQHPITNQPTTTASPTTTTTGAAGGVA